MPELIIITGKVELFNYKEGNFQKKLVYPVIIKLVVRRLNYELLPNKFQSLNKYIINYSKKQKIKYAQSLLLIVSRCFHLLRVNIALFKRHVKARDTSEIKNNLEMMAMTRSQIY